MAKEEFTNWKPNRSSLERLGKMNEILEWYEGKNINVTLRQLYYRLFAKGIIKKNELREYKMLGSLLSKARKAGLVDWDLIEDRVRRPHSPMEFSTITGAMNAMTHYFRLPRWNTQKEHVELWVEKDALSSVLQPITDEYHVTLVVNRGYSSTTAMKDAADRLKAVGKPCHVLYLGDLDPSGEDMVRDIEARLYEFRATEFDLTKIAITPKQAKKMKLIPAMAKTTDSRHQAFTDKFGEECFEVDAIEPEALQKLVTKAITDRMDLKAYNKVIKKEDGIRSRFESFIEDFDE